MDEGGEEEERRQVRGARGEREFMQGDSIEDDKITIELKK